MFQRKRDTKTAAMAIVMNRVNDGGMTMRTGVDALMFVRADCVNRACDAARTHAAISIFFMGKEGRNGPGLLSTSPQSSKDGARMSTSATLQHTTSSRCSSTIAQHMGV